MKVVAFNGSPRREGNTSLLLLHALAPVAQAGIEIEVVQVGGHAVHGCKACYRCIENRDGRCVQKGDAIGPCIEKMMAADGILLGSPTYFSDVTPEMKALIDRAGYVSRANGGLLRRKVGAGVVAVRRGGEIHAYDTLNHFFLINEMVVPGSIYWNMGFGRNPGEVERDDEGIRTMTVLGEHMAWLLQKIHG